VYVLWSVFMFSALILYFVLVHRLVAALRGQEYDFWVGLGSRGFYSTVQSGLALKYLFLRDFLPERFRSNNGGLLIAVRVAFFLNVAIYVLVFSLAAFGVGNKHAV